MPARNPAIAYAVTVRVQYPNRPGTLGQFATAIGEVGGDIGALDIVRSTRRVMVRDITVSARDVPHSQEIVARVRAIPGVRVLSISDPTFLRHLGGKIEVRAQTPLKTRSDLLKVDDPGSARVSVAIRDDPKAVWSLTTKGNSVAVVTDGTAVLGLGDIGPEAALPVMEGKAVLFKELAGVDAWPICLATQDSEEIIRAIKTMAPAFGAINLEDISAPRCFDIEERLREELDIPVLHDDQHCTAVTVLAALHNALKLVGKPLEELRVVVCGAGAAGAATGRLLSAAGVRNIIGYDKEGVLHRGLDYDGHAGKRWFATEANPDNVQGSLLDAMRGADVFIGLSGPQVLSVEHLKAMGRDPIVLAMANPDPEIFPEEASPFVRVMATGRSDYPNQVNNVLAFPGIFRGILDARASEFNVEMKLAAAWAIADIVAPDELDDEYIMPSVFNGRVATAVARAVKRAAQRTGVARRRRMQLRELAGNR